MPTQNNNNKGATAESIVHTILSRRNLECSVVRLGDKWPITDMYVEMTHRNTTYYFFLQVKSTSLGYTSTKRLQVQVPKAKLNKLSKYKAPTYLVGVNMKDKTVIPRAYIATIRGKYATGVSSMPSTSKYVISKANLVKLKDEVIAYWKNSPDVHKESYSSKFLLP